ncbi:MAG: hypothetical protein ACTSQA_00045 [Candidatus Heimdallarchaeaceae archaeon]
MNEVETILLMYGIVLGNMVLGIVIGLLYSKYKTKSSTIYTLCTPVCTESIKELKDSYNI